MFFTITPVLRNKGKTGWASFCLLFGGCEALAALPMLERVFEH